MTMSLVGPYLTTTSYKKPKQKKRTKAQQEQFEQSHREYNKSMKRMGCHDQMMSLADYDLYVRGMYKPKLKGVYTAPETKSYRRETPEIPSLGNGVGVATKKEATRYTGDLIVGIATMHKSNAVPVMRGTDQAKDIAAMRR
jgi:hypothetical protein